MSHGGCCNCFICKLGKTLGLMEDCCSSDKCCGGEKDCCKTAPKKSVKKVGLRTKNKPNKEFYPHSSSTSYPVQNTFNLVFPETC